MSKHHKTQGKKNVMNTKTQWSESMRRIVGGGELESKGRNTFHENFSKGEQKSRATARGKGQVKSVFFLLQENFHSVSMPMVVITCRRKT